MRLSKNPVYNYRDSIKHEDKTITTLDVDCKYEGVNKHGQYIFKIIRYKGFRVKYHDDKIYLTKSMLAGLAEVKHVD